MEGKINQLLNEIKCYRYDDQDQVYMSKEIIESWINQFDEEDREFFLEETTHIMKQRYITKENAVDFLRSRINFLKGELKYENVKDLLSDFVVISDQPDGKSQRILLEIFYDICEKDFDFDMRTHNNPKGKIYMYLDDILCTGDSFFKGISGKDNKTKGGFFYALDTEGRTNLEVFEENGAFLQLVYFCIHQSNIHKVFKRLEHKMGKRVKAWYSYLGSLYIDNNPNDNSAMDLIVPSVDLRKDSVLACEQQIKEKLQESPYYKEKEFFYRSVEAPVSEKLFSSAENRMRYERILLLKCIEIYNKSEGLLKGRGRPLGHGLYTDQSLGFGALIFTWRNIAYNTPIIFWYESKSWKPLFKRNYIEY
ncbi:phosphoribosyltransferase-like protein [Sphingobacterium siyangense]|uniref:phosphoribosyltransferase-like protein n=1 Tax=Sphingobacterium siyangense TaxID=459529 RepID=UPI003DA562B3